MTRSLDEFIEEDQFAGYAYAYPHKTAYRPLDPPVRLSEAWREEPKGDLFLYVHLPFCEMRCGFCNLFTTVRPGSDFVKTTLAAIQRQASIVADEIDPRRVTHLAFGGGTPSFLNVEELESVFDSLERCWPIDWSGANASFEISPATIDAAKLHLLRAKHVDRISMGVQSFSKSDLKQLGRPQTDESVSAAIELVKSAGVPIFNLDLIYGMHGQTDEAWIESLEETIRIAPEEVYLYPLYVRERTGLAKTGKSPSQRRRELYLIGRDQLLEAGYEQLSMRLFRRGQAVTSGEYCCQDDGMVGLGAGARSYTRSLHYSSEYAVGQAGVKSIIAEFNQRSNASFALADYGIQLNEGEQKRRYLIKSLLRREGLETNKYHSRFKTNVWEDFEQLQQVLEKGWLVLDDTDGRHLRLNAEGLSWSDVIGPWLYSEATVALMESYQLT